MQRCPHCHSKAEPVKCCRCSRQLCANCISHEPSVGAVCGLCQDEIRKAAKEQGK